MDWPDSENELPDTIADFDVTTDVERRRSSFFARESHFSYIEESLSTVHERLSQET